MNTVILKPAPSLQVRDPETLETLAEAGEEKELNTYWRRRIADGDVISENTPSPLEKEKKEETPRLASQHPSLKEGNKKKEK